MSKRVNITQVFDHLFGDFYGDPKKMKLLIQTLKEMGDKPVIDLDKASQLMENIQKHQTQKTS